LVAAGGLAVGTSCWLVIASSRWWRTRAASRRLRELLDAASGCDARVVITGASSGIGQELARQLELHPSVSLLLGNKDAKRCEQGRVRITPLELLDFVSVERFAREAHGFLLDGGNGLRLLINNAAVKEPPTSSRQSGISPTWQINFLGPFLLTELIAHLREASRAVRPLQVINVASGHENESQLDQGHLELASTGGNSRQSDYSDSKRALLLWTSIRAQSLAFKSHVFLHASNPGKVDTQLGCYWMPWWLWLLTKPGRAWRFASLAEGALSIIIAGLRPEATYKFGEYLGGEQPLEDLVVWRMPEKQLAVQLYRWAAEVTDLERRRLGQPCAAGRGSVAAVQAARRSLSDDEVDRWSNPERRMRHRAKESSRSGSTSIESGSGDSDSSAAT